VLLGAIMKPWQVIAGIRRKSSVPSRTRRRVSFALACLALTSVGACDSGHQPTAQPSKATGSSTPRLTLIAPESEDWTREEAARHLADEELGISAAIRLIHLTETTVLSVPAELTDDHIRRLQLLQLSEERWALGVSDREQPGWLHAPVFISADGIVDRLANGTEEEVLTLHVSEDAEIFPHLALLPDRVLLVEEKLIPAIILQPDQPVCLVMRKDQGFPYVALVLAHAEEGAEVARYIWDPYELVFTGPAVDKLPDTPGGKFHVDLPACERLEPIGGEIPEPAPIEVLPEDVPDEPIWNEPEPPV